MKNPFLFLSIVLLLPSCTSSVIVATFNNRNVYKTKANLQVEKVWHGDRPATDIRQFTLMPNTVPAVVKTEVKVETSQADSVGASNTTTTTIVSTIPETNFVKTENKTSATSSPATVTTTTTTYSVPNGLSSSYFLRYKVILDDGDYKYIKLLDGVQFNSAAPTEITFQPTNVDDSSDEPEDYIFRVSKKSLVPNTHYLASSALIGKVITLPLRVRNEYWNKDNKVLQGTLAIAYGFGWKYKLGNNPYQPNYLTTILYAAGISQQKHFSIASTDENGVATLTEKTDEIAVTYFSFGVAYEFDRFNVGVFAGKDRMFGNLKNWVYQNRWWWGIGIGYDLFK